MKIRIGNTALSMVIPTNRWECQEDQPYCYIVCNGTTRVAKVQLDPVVLEPHHKLSDDEVPIVLENVNHYAHWFIHEYIFQGMDR